MLTLEQVLLAASRFYSLDARDQQEFPTPGTYAFVVPEAVTEISAVAIGGGGAGASNTNDGGGGGGGGLQYRNNIAVTPGEVLTVVVGNGGLVGSTAGNGGHSAIFRSSTSLVYAVGGAGANSIFGGAGGNSGGLGAIGGAGGSGSAAFGGNFLTGGGGGAAGYTASGGAGGNGNNSIGQASTGGGGGGGNADNTLARGGGGTGLQGISNNGVGNGGGGSSYNAVTSTSSAALNTGGDLFPVDLHYAWGNFINTYGVWVTARGADDGQFKTVQRGFYAPYSGTYTIEYSADNQLNFRIDGSLVAVTTDFTRSATTTTYMSIGEHRLTFEIQNYGATANWYSNPAGFALTIRDSTNNLIWDTRTYRLQNSGNLLVKVQAGGTASSGQHGGIYGGGGGGRDTDFGSGAGGNGGGGGVRIIWGRGRSYPYRAQDVIPVTIASTLQLILHYDAANVASYNGGNTVFDISGNANHGTISLGYAPSFVPSIGTNKVIRFPISQNTKIDFSANELTAQRITVEMWALVDDFVGGMFFGWNIHDVWTSGGTLGFNTGQGDVYGISAARINQLNLRDRWAHYVFVMNVGDYRQNKIYVNGVSQALSQQFSNQFTPYTNFNSGNGRIGGWRLDNNYQQVMDLGIFKIYNRELTQAEITTNYNEDLARFSTPIYYAGLYGRRVGGYYNDNVNYFAGRGVSEFRTISDFSYFSSYTDQYSWEFVGYFRAPFDGTYTFYTTSDDASHLWLGATAQTGYSTGNALVNNGGLHGARAAAGSINLTQGTYYPIRIHFGENYGADVLIVTIYGPHGVTNGSGYFFHDDGSRNF